MAIGKSGRIVIEIEPSLKQSLYSALALRQLTLREWFIAQADGYLNGDQGDQQTIEFAQGAKEQP